MEAAQKQLEDALQETKYVEVLTGKKVMDESSVTAKKQKVMVMFLLECS